MATLLVEFNGKGRIDDTESVIFMSFRNIGEGVIGNQVVVDVNGKRESFFTDFVIGYKAVMRRVKLNIFLKGANQDDVCLQFLNLRYR